MDMLNSDPNQSSPKLLVNVSPILRVSNQWAKAVSAHSMRSKKPSKKHEYGLPQAALSL
jgi:hypothetical protein